MSMRDYAVDDYGLVIDEQTMRILAEKVCKDFDEQAWNNDKYELIDEIMGELGIECAGDFTGEAMKIDDDGSNDYSCSFDYRGEPIYYIPVMKYPTMFSAAYRNMNQLVDEFRDKLWKFLQIDFDYRNYIRHIVGTYYG